MNSKKTLEQEAEYYAHNYFDMHSTHYKGLLEGFTFGVNSKWVEEEKIKFAIKQMEDLIVSKNWSAGDFKIIDNKIRQLKELKE